MPIELTWETAGVLRKFSGKVTESEVAESRGQVAGDWRFDTLRYVINDYLDGEIGDGITTEMAEYAAAHDGAAAITNPRILIACVTTDMAVLALIQTYTSSGMSPYTLRVFSTVDETREWIGRQSQ